MFLFGVGQRQKRIQQKPCVLRGNKGLCILYSEIIEALHICPLQTNDSFMKNICKVSFARKVKSPIKNNTKYICENIKFIYGHFVLDGFPQHHNERTCLTIMLTLICLKSIRLIVETMFNSLRQLLQQKR